MAQFQRTNMHWVTAIGILLCFYAVGGTLYSLWNTPPGGDFEGVSVWIGVGIVALISIAVNEWRIRRKRA